MRSILLLLCFLAPALLFSQGKDARAKKLDAIFSDLHSRKMFNGAVVVGQNGRILFSKGYGYANYEAGIRYTTTTPTDGGSLAKTITAASILSLAAEGRLKLDDPIEKHLPGYPFPDSKVIQLINHGAGGLPGYGFYFQQVNDSAVVSNETILESISNNNISLVFKPGENFFYDSPAFDLAALLVENLEGKKFDSFIQNRFFAPAGIQSSFIRPARFSEWKGPRAIAYSLKGDSIVKYDIDDREGFYGGSNLWFTAEDLYRWGTSFYRSKKTRSIDSLAALPSFINGKLSGVTLGSWYLGMDEGSMYYWGSVAGFYSWLYVDRRSKFTIAFVSNMNTAQWMRPLLTHNLVKIMKNQPVNTSTEPPGSILQGDSTNTHTGVYQIPNVGRTELIYNGTNLVKMENGMFYHIYQVDRKTFYIPGIDAWVRFSDCGIGKCEKIFWISTRLVTEGKRITTN